MKYRVPRYKRPRVFRQFESSKKNAGGKNYNPIQNSFNYSCDPFVELANENKADAKATCHQCSQQVDTYRQPRTVKPKTPSEIPNKP